MSCPALQLTSQKPKRDRFDRCKKHRRKGGLTLHAHRARLLADALREQRRTFPGFAGRIDEFIAQVEADGSRSRRADRAKVMDVMRNWGALGIREIMEDTGFSHWDVRQILSVLIAEGKVTKKREPRSGIRPAAWRLIYSLNS